MRRGMFPRFRRRGWEFIKILAFVGLCWYLIAFGFSQKSESSFGELLDRNRIEKLGEVSNQNQIEKNFVASDEQKFEVPKVKTHLYAEEVTQSDPKKHKVEVIAVDFDEIKEEIAKKIAPKLNSIFDSETIKKEENIWTFSKPPNIFKNDSVGEFGVAWKMPSVLPPEIKKLVEDGWQTHQFNQYLSDLISVQRKLPDYRGEYCRAIESSYSKSLPATSVIIIFHNEAWSTLLRTVHSVLDRSPVHLITEVILVDDFSNLEHLKRPLEVYMEKLKKVKIVRADKREGLIKARLRGAEAAHGPVLTFLDSHVECTQGWLEPLLDRIEKDKKNVVVPIIEVIDDTTFWISNLTAGSSIQVGGFTWKMTFDWHLVPEEDRKRKQDPYEPTRSPAMAGGLFSIDKAYFDHLGKYDPGMDIWGAENIEMSIRVWTCGGNLEIIPCSKVGHIFRRISPYTWRPGKNVARINTLRMVEVWLDDYAKYFYARNGKKNEDIGDISDRIKLKKDLGCKSFQWFLDNVFPALKPPENMVAFGEIRNLGNNERYCLDALDIEKAELKVYGCHGLGGNQYWEMTVLSSNLVQIKRDKYSFIRDGDKLIIKSTIFNSKEQNWFYIKDSKQIFHPSSSMCLTLSASLAVQLQTCASYDPNQKWKFENIAENKLSNSFKP